ncbi:MAG: hypothetical protein LBG60_06855, partial [Bifidobacteriaceae bacterium]|nr:hypothetical protein [Bifidobacteriaceae bacterium]
MAPAETTRRGRVWLWAGLTAAAVFSMVSFPVMWAVAVLANLAQPSFFNQHETWTFALWSLAGGIFTLLVARLTYRRYSKAHGLDLRATGVILERRQIGRTIILGVLAAVVVYALVFLVDWLFRPRSASRGFWGGLSAGNWGFGRAWTPGSVRGQAEWPAGR